MSYINKMMLILTIFQALFVFGFLMSQSPSQFSPRFQNMVVLFDGTAPFVAEQWKSDLEKELENYDCNINIEVNPNIDPIGPGVVRFFKDGKSILIDQNNAYNLTRLLNQVKNYFDCNETINNTKHESDNIFLNINHTITIKEGVCNISYAIDKIICGHNFGPNIHLYKNYIHGNHLNNLLKNTIWMGFIWLILTNKTINIIKDDRESVKTVIKYALNMLLLNWYFNLI